GLTGPTTMGLIKVVDSEKYTFTLAGAADEVTPKLIQGELDMAAIPANLASVLYNNTQGKIRVLAVNTLGVLYITEKGDTVTDVASLKGKTIYATGKGSTPEYTLKHILKENGIDPENDVTIEFKSEPAEIVALLENAEGGVAMLPQPYVTAAMSKVEGLHIVLNLSEEWDKLGSDSKLITGVLVGRSDFIDANPEAVETFLNEYKESVDWVVNNTEEASELIDKYGIVKAAIAKKALPMCNITFISGEEMKTNLSGYLNVLFEANPKAVGGSLPGDDFYYGN
ncbi:MAG: ABC transporter substrate-binding protein, partial [Eubacteriales bacterium]|nr:ABC transporter substrate-binding protein [Eubacteriales bacterium]